MALALSLGAGIPVHPRRARARCISSKACGKLQTHTRSQWSWASLPPSPSDPVWNAAITTLCAPPWAAAAFSLFIWTNRITVGLQWIDCDEGMLWPGTPLLLDVPSRFSLTFPEQWSAVVLTSLLRCVLSLWLMGKRGGCFANATAGGNICLWEHKSTYLSPALRRRTHVWQHIHVLSNGRVWSRS